MLVITIRPTAEDTTLRLEGKLGRPWVRDLEQLWEHARENLLYRPVRVDLSLVRLIDREGRRVLAGMHDDGAELTADDPLMKSVIRDLAYEAGHSVWKPGGRHVASEQSAVKNEAVDYGAKALRRQRPPRESAGGTPSVVARSVMANRTVAGQDLLN